MRVGRHRQFRKHFKQRIEFNTSLVNKFDERLRLFLSNARHPLLNDHQLSGSKKSYRAFSVTGDIRVVYRIEGDVVRLYDIATHNQVY